MADGRGGGLRVTDPRVMRALAHPARIEIVEYLNDTGAAVTATEAAEMVGLSPSATSYHLRELAKYGLVEQAPSRGDGRERIWRGTGNGVRIDPDLDQPEALAASRELVALYLGRDLARMQEWWAQAELEPAEWRDASTILGQRLLITVDELRELNQQVHALLERYKLRERKDDAPEGARQVRVNYAAFPDD